MKRKVFSGVWLAGFLLAALTLARADETTVQLTGYHRVHNRHNYAQRSRQAQIGILENQLQAANDFLAAAQKNAKNANSKDDGAKSALSQTRSQMEQDKHEQATLAAALRRLEESILAEQQDTDTPYGRAFDADKDALEEVARLEEEITTSDAYLAKSKKIAGDKAKALLLDLKREMLKDDADYQVARDELKQAQEELGKQRDAVLKSDDNWVKLYDSLRTTERDLQALESHARSQGLHKLAAGNALRANGQTVASAEAMVAAIQNRLNQMGVNNYGKKR